MESSILDMIAGFMPSGPPEAPATAEGSGLSLSTPARTPAVGRTHDEMRRRDVHMICFSKDRAFQLDQLLESSSRHLLLADEDQSSGIRVTLHTSVLFIVSPPSAAAAAAAATSTTSTANTAGRSGALGEGNVSVSPVGGPVRSMEDSYDMVRRRHPSVTFIREEPGRFCDQLLELVESSKDRKQGGEAEAFVLFAVDDMFFYRDFGLPGALRLLSSDPSVFCAHLRLHPGITWSHTAGSPCDVPPLSHIGRKVSSLGRNSDQLRAPASYTRTATKDPPKTDSDQGRVMDHGRPMVAADFSLLTFARNEVTGEWNYPWDLTGGLYRREDAMVVLHGVVGAYGKKAAANPNLLEYHGHRLLSKIRCQQQSRHSSVHPGSSRSRPPVSGGSATPAVIEAVTNERSCHAAGRESRVQSPMPPAEGKGAPAATAAAATAVKVASAAPRCACSGRAVVSSLAVNRVQSTYSTPIYNSHGGGVLDLDRRLWSLVGATSRCVDGEHERDESGHRQDTTRGTLNERGAMTGRGGFNARAYRRRSFASVHVGQLFFQDNTGEAHADVTQRGYIGSASRPGEINTICSEVLSQPKPSVTVLLPVKNGGARLVDAVQSVLTCAQRTPTNWKIELLIIDDGSEDGAVEEALATVGLNVPSGEAVGTERGENEEKEHGSKGTVGSGKKFGESATADVPTARQSSFDTVTTAGAATATATVSDKIGASNADGTGACLDSVRLPLVVRVIRHVRSLGVAMSLNEGLREARSELVARMDADDVCMPERLKEQTEFMYANPGVSVLGSAVATFNGDCVRSGQMQTNIKQGAGKRQPQRDEQLLNTIVNLPADGVQRIVRYPTDRAFLSWSLLFGCCIAHPSVILRRDRVIAAGGYDPEAEPAEDYDLWLRMDGSAPGCLANAGEATAVRTPELAVSVEDLVEGSRLLCDLEAIVIDQYLGGAENPQKRQVRQNLFEVSERGGFATTEDNSASVENDGDGQRRWSRELISRDVEARLGALAVHAMKSFGGGAAPVLDIWRGRYPDRALLRVLGGKA
ncbi:unnamed protein product [Ascophyllum nodosum]